MNMDSDIKAHYNKVGGILIAVLALNWIVAAAKIFYGIASRSSSIAADGFHSLSDGASNVVGLIGIHLACQPIDKDHPYGHKKYETLFAMGIGAFLVAVSFNILKGGIVRLYNPVVPNIDIVSFVVMVTTLAVNIIVMNYEYRRGKALQSDILTSDAMHTKADIFTSLSVIASLAAVKAGYPVFDPLATILISLFIAYSAFIILRDSSRVLCDTVVIMDVKAIERVVLGVKGVRACHKIRSRGRRDDIHLDLHVLVNPQMHVGSAHKVSYEIEAAIKDAIPGVTDVMVHIEPKERPARR